MGIYILFNLFTIIIRGVEHVRTMPLSCFLTEFICSCKFLGTLSKPPSIFLTIKTFREIYESIVLCHVKITVYCCYFAKQWKDIIFIKIPIIPISEKSSNLFFQSSCFYLIPYIEANTYTKDRWSYQWLHKYHILTP